MTRVLGYCPASGLGRILATQHAGHRRVVGAEITFTSHLAATLLTMARDGLGAAWLPLTLSDDDLRSGRLIRAGAPTFDIPVDIRLFRSPDCRSHAADQLWDHLNGLAKSD